MADLSEVECHCIFWHSGEKPEEEEVVKMCGRIVLHLLIIGMLEVLNCSFLDTNGMNGWGLGWYNVGINPNWSHLIVFLSQANPNQEV